MVGPFCGAEVWPMKAGIRKRNPDEADWWERETLKQQLGANEDIKSVLSQRLPQMLHLLEGPGGVTVEPANPRCGKQPLKLILKLLRAGANRCQPC
jgi:hypothetical protein